MILVIAELAIPILAFLALGKLVSDPGILKTKKNTLYYSFGLTGGIILLFYIAPSIFFDFLRVLLSEIEKISDPRIVFWYFLLKLSSYLGFKPAFNVCSICNKSIISEEVVFSIREGAAICENCGFSSDSGWKLSTNVRRSLSDLQSLNHKGLSSVDISLDNRFVYTDFLLTYLRYHSDEKLDLSSLKIFK